MKKKLWGKYITCWVFVVVLILLGVAICYGVANDPPTTTRAIFLVGIVTGLIFADAFFMGWLVSTPLAKYLWYRIKHKPYSIIRALGGKG